MRATIIAAALAVVATPAILSAQTAAPAATTDTAKKAAYSTNSTEIGTLLDDPAARVVLDKYIPGMTTSDQVDMARGMTLKDIQQYSPDQITDQMLASMDAEFAKLPAKPAGK